jgi:hypothetical protein
MAMIGHSAEPGSSGARGPHCGSRAGAACARSCRMPLALLTTGLLALSCGCGGSISVSRGTSIAATQRTDAARMYWPLYDSVNGSVTKAGGTGNFVPCSVPAGTTIRYGVEAPFEGRTASETKAQFARALEQDFSHAGIKLGASAAGPLSARKGNIQVTLKPLRSLATGPYASLTVVTSCFDAGSAARRILQRYGGADGDLYRGQQAPASPLPSGFPWDSAQATSGGS